jgi:hypothetical protein
MQKENTIELDPAFIKQKNFCDETTFDNIIIEKFELYASYKKDGGEFWGYDKVLAFFHKTTDNQGAECLREFLTFTADASSIEDQNKLIIRDKKFKFLDFLEYQKLINQALDYIATYNKTIETN